MIINGIEFDFSTLNANDVDRMLARTDPAAGTCSDGGQPLHPRK